MSYHHTVLFKFKPGTTERDIQKALQLLTDLGQDHQGLDSWAVHRSLDERKGVILIQESVFAGQEDFENFRSSQNHQEVSAFFREIADWWVADYLS
jgi:hypothetical protein